MVLFGEEFTISCRVYYCGPGTVEIDWSTNHDVPGDPAPLEIRNAKTVYQKSVGKKLGMTQSTVTAVAIALMRGRMYTCTNHLTMTVEAESTDKDKMALNQPERTNSHSFRPLIVFRKCVY